jgi:hypothetical protein
MAQIGYHAVHHEVNTYLMTDTSTETNSTFMKYMVALCYIQSACRDCEGVVQFHKFQGMTPLAGSCHQQPRRAAIASPRVIETMSVGHPNLGTL